VAGRDAASVLFIVTEDWFFASHFLPMVRAARELGLHVTVVTRVRDHGQPIEACGATVVALDADRSSLNPVGMARTVTRLTAILKEAQPTIVHCIALRAVILGGLAARRAGIDQRVYALTGLGFLGARQDAAGHIARVFIRRLLRGPLDGPATRFLFENRDDPRLLGLDPQSSNVAIVGGAGVDPDRFMPRPLPLRPPLRIAVVARMLWSKGIDLAVEATRQARKMGAQVELSLYGAPDPANPRAFAEDTLRAWSNEDGIRWHGPTRDVAAVWRDHHVACLASRGGEGLPRTLLEAAACGRAIVTTDVPGCRTLVRDGVEGLVVTPNDAGALAQAFVRLTTDESLVRRYGAAARARVLDGFTEEDVSDRLKALYRGMLAGAPGPKVVQMSAGT
jgi:glycosyltransferase involved in cell wall biosynthesis